MVVVIVVVVVVLAGGGGRRRSCSSMVAMVVVPHPVLIRACLQVPLASPAAHWLILAQAAKVGKVQGVYGAFYGVCTERPKIAGVRG